MSAANQGFDKGGFIGAVGIVLFGLVLCSDPGKEDRLAKKTCGNKADYAVMQASKHGVTDRGLLRNMHSKIKRDCEEKI